MFSGKILKSLLVSFVIVAALIVSRNLILTGFFINPEQPVYIGLIKPSPYENCQVPQKTCDEINTLVTNKLELGMNMLVSSPQLGNRIFEIYTLSVSDFSGNSKKSSTNIFHISDGHDWPETRNKIGEGLFFSQSLRFCYPDADGSIYILRDAFLTPAVIMADHMRESGIKNVGIVYVKPPIDIPNCSAWDYDQDFYELVFGKILGQVAFTDTYYIENKTGSTSIIGYIQSTKPDAIVFVGYGTFFGEFLNLLKEVRSSAETNTQLYSIGWGSGDINPSSLETIKDVFFTSLYYGDMTPHVQSGYMVMEILHSVVPVCNSNVTCMRNLLNGSVIDIKIGSVKFRRNGILMRPYLVYKVDFRTGDRISEKKYDLAQIENIVSAYNIDF